MPTSTVSSASRIHSCSVVYFRFSGYTRRSFGESVGRLSVLGLAPHRQRGHVDRLSLVDVDAAAERLDDLGHAAGKLHSLAQRVWVADHVDVERWLDDGAVDADAVGIVGEVGLGDDAGGVVDLDRLSAGVA